MIRLQKRDLSYTILNISNFNELLEKNDGTAYVELLYSRSGVQEVIELSYANYNSLPNALNIT